ncbi:unnamed protein product [Porites evermanni]|uniref:Peptidylglycine monooxygenase n=1 Tax=Porites evermanni TaxID=104178 RepID=A0ABN8LC53_9CNID|nr:unnamed protein product [Porites evermanni]
MDRKSVAVLILIVVLTLSVILAKSFSYDFFDDQARDYYDTLYQREIPRERVKSQRLNVVDFKMPGIHPEKHDSYMCTALDLSDQKHYIVGFKPFAEMHTAHHMLMFGCQTPGENLFAKDKKYWNCGDMGSGVCGSGEKIVYAWGRNAPELKLPNDVAFEVGHGTAAPYLVLQVHYGKVDKFKADPYLKDYSGVDLETTTVAPRHLAAIHLSASGGYIEAKRAAWHLDVGCNYGGSPVMHPFAFRVHAHKLGTVISGYKVRDGVWTLIGKGDPQRPQAFYPVKSEKDLSIQMGDTIAARCTYNSTQKNDITYIGATMADEMCNFYMMYWYDPKENDMEGSPEERCGYVNERGLQFPNDSDVRLPGSGEKMELKRDFVEGCEPSCDDEESVFLDEDTAEWPGNNPANVKLGQVTAVDTDADGNVVIFHRGSRRWQADSFNDRDVFNHQDQPIPEATVLKLDPKTGEVKKSWGENMFFMPHGLTIDHEGNTWLTDVALHQVFKVSPGETKPSLTLGVRFEPGKDADHFCKPTDVAVDSKGVFYVSDGYCNSRVMKFSPDGKESIQMASNAFRIPHSLSLDEANGRLYVADRENSRVLALDAGSGSLLREVKDFGERVFAVHYHAKRGGVLHVVNGPLSYYSRAQGFTFSLKSDSVVQKWSPALGFSEPHDVTSDSHGASVFVADIGSNTVWKFKRRVQKIV